MLTLYTDGGVIQRNPSPFGGTWAWVLVDDDEIQDQGWGIIAPDIMGVLFVTNNQTELLAVIMGLKSLYKDEIAHICSDSEITLGRLFRGSPFNNIPKWMINGLYKEKARLEHFSRFTYELMDGHPTQEQLRSGKGKKGHTTSKWNVWCDQKCNQLASEYMEKLHEVV